MEYKKETEKFSLGFGSDSGLDDEEIKRIRSAVEKKDDKTANEDFLEAALGIAAIVGVTYFRLKFGRKKSKKKK